MHIRVSGAEFTKVTKRIIKLAGDSVNLLLKDGRLNYQTAGIIMDEGYYEILESDNEPFDISVKFESILELVSKDLDVDLSIQGDILVITQGSFSCHLSRLYGERVETNAFNYEYEQVYDFSELMSLSTQSRALDEVARNLASSLASVNIKNNLAYIAYKSIALIIPVRMPDMALNCATLRRLATTLSDAKERKFHLEGDVIGFKCSSKEIELVTINKPSKSVIETMDVCLSHCKHIATVNIAKYASIITILTIAYKKMNAKLSICKNGIGICISNSNTFASVGETADVICTITVTTGSLLAILKLFGEASVVDIEKGDNLICLTQKNVGLKLLISGLIY